MSQRGWSSSCYPCPFEGCLRHVLPAVSHLCSVLWSPDVPLCCATLRWLLAENPGAEALSSTEVASVCGMAPDGGHVQLLVREARNGLALSQGMGQPAGKLPVSQSQLLPGAREMSGCMATPF